MSRPGTTITRSEARPARSARTGTGPWFTVGVTGTADTVASPAGPRTPCRSLAEYAARFGSRSSHTNDGTGAGGAGAFTMYDQAEFFFKEGGAEMYVSPATYNVTPATLETNIATALALFTKDLGPGQVSVPGRITAATRLAVAAHGDLTNRLAVLATTGGAVTSATMITDAAIASITQTQERVTTMWGPWLTVPGVTSGTTRTISPECIVAGIIARNDALGVSPNEPSAGQNGQSDYGIDVLNAYDDATRLTLSLNGVNLLRDIYDGVRVYGFRTLADATTDANWILASNARLFMAIQALADEVGERFMFRQIDGQRKTINEFNGALTGVVMPFYQRGSLYGATPEEAFRVDTGPNINTDATIANGELRANIALRVSPFAEEVIMELVKVKITETI
jgi:hypothetical protein